MEPEKVTYHENGTIVEIERVYVGKKPISALLLDYLKNQRDQPGLRTL